MSAEKPIVILMGPSRGAVSGVSTHLNLLFGSCLASDFRLVHFQVGSEGRDEGPALALLRFMLSPLALGARILGEGADVVHINTSINFRAYWRDLAYLLVAKLCGARVVYQVHGGALPEHFTSGNKVLDQLLRITLSLPDAIVVLTQNEFLAYRDFVPDQVILLFPNAIDLTPYAKSERNPTEMSAALRLIYVGRLARNKGVNDGLQGLALAHAHGVAATLVIAGSGPDELPLRALVEKLALNQFVRFTGPVFDEKKLALYGHADILLFPTYHAEGLPYVLLESMAAGVPAITTRTGGIPDVMIDGVHGLFVPPCNAEAICAAIKRLANDRSLLENMSLACQRRIAHSYSIERLADELGGLYRELCPRLSADLARKP